MADFFKTLAAQEVMRTTEVMMTLGYISLFVDDVATSVQFFTSAFGIDTRFVHESLEWTELETGTTRLSFTSRRSMAGVASPAPPSDCFSITLIMNDVASAFARAVAAGGVPLQAPLVKPWGQTVAYVRSPDGFIVELGTPIGS